ncbi:unnamed protein product [Bathycoccus prasinos]
MFPRHFVFLFQVLLAFFFISFSGLHQSSSSSFNFVQGKTKLNIKSSGIDMVHASHILCASNRTLCEDIMELLEPFAEDDLLRPKLERGFEELARKFSRCPTGKRIGGDLGYFPRGEMTKDFDAIVFSELAAPLHKPVGPHQTSNGFHVIMVHDRHLADAEMREQARIATEEAKKKREESFKRNMKKEQGKQERKGARANARQERRPPASSKHRAVGSHDEF